MTSPPGGKSNSGADRPQSWSNYGVSFKEVMERLAANNKAGRRPVPERRRRRYLVRGLGLVSSAADISTIVIAEAQRCADLHVRRGRGKGSARGALRRGHAQWRGRWCSASRCRASTKTPPPSSRRSGKLAVAQAALPKGVELKAVYDRTEIVDKALKTSTNALIEGSDPGGGDLFLFLGEFARPSSSSSPAAGDAVRLHRMQRLASANLMSLAGLAIGIGMMVDGAVVMVENAFRLLSHARSSGKPINPPVVVLEAAREVRTRSPSPS